MIRSQQEQRIEPRHPQVKLTTVRGASNAAEQILDAALEIANRQDAIIARLRVAVRKRQTREIVRLAKELCRDEKGD